MTDNGECMSKLLLTKKVTQTMCGSDNNIRPFPSYFFMEAFCLYSTWMLRSDMKFGEQRVGDGLLQNN